MQVLTDLAEEDWFADAFALQVWAQKTFHGLARRVAGGTLAPRPGEACLTIERNFFSTFFLAVTRQAVGPSKYMPLFAMVNQAMRAWVTACDNILDDEYKEIFPFTFADSGRQMRSVLTLLIADRVAAEYVVDAFDEPGLLARVGRVSLSALMSSAIQESQEEARPVALLPPGQILDDIHQRKTGDLFMAPLALPEALEPMAEPVRHAAQRALCRFGLGCQILDDAKDMAADLQAGRHNLLVSLLAADPRWGAPGVDELRASPAGEWNSWDRFPDAFEEAWQLAMTRFADSFDALARLGIDLSPAQRDGVVGLMARLLGISARAGVGAFGAVE
ncbi:MAG: class 1 isoprenoid biosynthesis enzyme [Planctomycetota bacterium]|nr:class 1 isoprenoid biosynthesis enzyme [Planctomycetota bacterium]